MGLKPVHTYLDSCLVIYLVEEHPTFAALLENSIANAPNSMFVVSDLTEMECLVMPIRKNNQQLIDKYYDWFEKTKVISLNKVIFHQAAKLRADFTSLKTPDALHLATAIYNNCDEFWTNDNRLSQISPIVKNILIV